MSDKLIDAFAKKVMEYIHDDKISDKEYLRSYDRLVKRWIDRTGSASRASIRNLQNAIGKAVRKAMCEFRADPGDS